MGYEQSVLSQISQLRDILQRYHGFAVIRELIQNADDAGATRLDLGCVGPLEGADHPLLQGGPALFILNDGPFSPENARSIKQLGLSDKAGDGGTIGKFGLGLKSIHHYGEVYFYLSPANFEGSPLFPTYQPNEIQNPWHGRYASEEDCLYPNWNEFTAGDRNRIYERLRPLLLDNSWFCLYVPLRQLEQVGEELNAIAPQFPGDDPSPSSAIFEADFEAEVARLLPFLRHLRAVRRWSDEVVGTLREMSSVSFEGKYQQLRAELPPDGFPSPLNGVIRIDRREPEISTRLTFAGRECYQNHPDFERIACRKDWPRPISMPRPGHPGGRSVSQAEPAIPHAAACFARTPTPGKPGRFVIAWASYLPVKLPCEPETNLRSPEMVTLTLHGRFFVDAGREGIDFGDSAAPSHSRTVRQEWNDTLRDDGTLDLIIPALEEFATALSPDESPGLVRELAEILQGSPLFRKFRGPICRRHQWVYLIGRDGSRWTRLEVGNNLHAVPEPTAAEPPLVEVFPRLPLLDGQDFRLTYQNWPSLRSSDDLLSWPENALLSILKTDQTPSFADPARMGLLVRTLRVAMGDRRPSAVVDRLVEVARAGMATLGYSGVVQRREMIASFLDLIPMDRKLRVDLGETHDGVVGSLLAPLWDNGWKTLIVPFGQGNARSSGTEREAMVGRLLTLESEGLTDAFLETRADLACQLVQSSQGDRDTAWSGLEQLAIFPASCNADGSSTLVTRAILETARRTDRLFVDHFGLSAAFRDALGIEANGQLVTMSRRLADSAFGKGIVPDASAAACLAGLAARPPLTSEVGRRIGLINRLIAAPGILDDAESCLSVRYLLHANPTHFDDASTLLVEAEADDGQATVWRELAARALRQDEAVWRLIPASLASRLNAEQRGQLGLHTINRPGVVRLLRDHGPGRLDLSDLAEEDIRTLLDDCRLDDFAVIRDLPIHRTVSGSRVSIDDKCHWRGDFPVEADIAASVTVLEPHPDKAIAQKQQQIHPKVLDARGVLRLILDEPAAYQRWRTILEALTAIGAVPGNLSLELRGTRWVPIAADQVVRPNQVVRVLSKDQAINDILITVARTSEDVVSFLELPESFRKHVIFARLLINEGEALEKLGQVLGRDVRYRVGGLSRDQARIEALRLLFDDAPQGVMPSLPLLKDETSRGNTRAALDLNLTERLIPHLLGAIPAERTVAILNFLADRHRSAAVAEKDRYLDAFCHYLEAATRADQSVADLPGVPLLSQAGTWTTADRLTMGATHIVPSSMLHRRLELILADHADRSDRQGSRPPKEPPIDTGKGADSYLEEERQNVAVLAGYLEEWSTTPRAVARELIGGLLALLGDSPPMLEAARRFLGNHGLGELREKLKWDPTGRFISGGVEQGGSGRDLHQTMKSLRVYARLSEGDTVELTNLLGDPIEVIQAREYDHLMLSSDDPNPGISPRHLTLHLRRVNPRLIPENLDPTTVLRQTARQVLRAVEKVQKVPNFDQVWDALAQSEQLDLEIAQKCLLDGLVNTMQSLGLRNQPPLADSIRHWHEANRSLVQIEAGDTRRRVEVEKRKQAARDAIGNLIATDAEAQRHCLEAVRDKLRTFEYTLESIPFELFQNADDAVTEWLALERSERPADAGRHRFEVEEADRSIRFASWGRAINHHQRGDVDGKQWGYDQDLEKMLTLNWSDKGHDERTTGKFGLGFKCVLLATDRPRIVSGRLAFEIVGGLYPVRLGAELHKELTTRLVEQNPDESGGTIVELPLNSVDPGAVLDRFRKLHPFLAVFGRQIRICKVMTTDGKSVTSEWKPERLGGNHALEVGELNGVGRLLVLRGRSTTLALSVTREGIARLPDHVPTVWVTAPTQQVAKLGFAINAAFTLDIGRLQLAHTSNENIAVVDRAGRELGDLLLALYHQAEADWPGFQQDLCLGEAVTPYLFWGSLWNLLTRPLATTSDPLGLLLRRLFWGASGHGMRFLMHDVAVIPNGLPGVHASLIRLAAIRSVISGLLENDQIYCEVSPWASFRAKFPSGSIVSGRIFNDLKGILKHDLHEAPIVSLASLVQSEVAGEPRADPELAARLGHMISPQSLEIWAAAAPEGIKDRDALVDILKQVQFQAGDGRWRFPADLVVRPGAGSGQADDEGLQAGFAPDRSVLNPSYSGDAVAFFEACRSAACPSPSILADWAIEAGEPVRRLVLDYIIRGALAHDLAEELTRREKGHWLGQLDEPGISKYKFNPHQAQVILGRLKISNHPTNLGIPNSPAPPNPQVALQRIHDWWTANRATAVDDYEREWYPDARFPDLGDNPDHRLTAEQRKAWMVLLMLGAMHTIGRARPVAHRGFLERCERKGWLDTFSRPTTQLDGWMGILIEYFDGNVADSPYLQWMGRFASIFQLAHWLTDYVEAYLAIGRVKEPFEMEGILNLRTSGLMQGSGRDAPPVTRTLGIGACFVIRELVRNGHLANDHAHRHCYVPTARVRRLFNLLGCRGLDDGYKSASERIMGSATIHDFLVQHLDEAKSTFHGDFDLPFVTLTEPKYRLVLERILNISVNGELDLDEVTEEEVI